MEDLLKACLAFGMSRPSQTKDAIEDTGMMARRMPFPMSSGGREVNEAINERIWREVEVERDRYMSRSNVWRIKHGKRWRTMHADEPEEPSETKLHSFVSEISKTKIVNHELVVLHDFMDDLANKMSAVFVQTMFEVMGDATGRTGNIVSGMPLKQSLEAALSGITFGVDKYGKPSKPHMIVHPEMARKIEELARQPDAEHSARIALITEHKESEAVATEARRVARYSLT